MAALGWDDEMLGPPMPIDREIYDEDSPRRLTGGGPYGGTRRRPSSRIHDWPASAFPPGRLPTIVAAGAFVAEAQGRAVEG